MRKPTWQFALGIILLTHAAFLYFIHYAIFRDAHHIFIYLLGDISFVHIEVLLATLIIHKVLSDKERKSKLEKMNMIIGTFFSELGIELLNRLSCCDPVIVKIRESILITPAWVEKKFKGLNSDFSKHSYGKKNT